MKRFYSETKSALDEIAERREQEPTRRHNEAIERFKYVYPDVFADQRAAIRVITLREEMKEDAAKKGELIDWDSAYRTIGDKIRAERGR
jgi:hypothetical protein